MENQRERAVHDTRAKLFEHECNASACIHARVKRDKGWRDTVWKGAGVGMREFECTPIELRAQEFPNSPNFRRRWNSKCSYKVSCEAMRHRGTEWVSKRNRQRERRGGGLKGLVEDNDANGCCGDKLRLDFIGMARGNREVFKHASVMRQGNS